MTIGMVHTLKPVTVLIFDKKGHKQRLLSIVCAGTVDEVDKERLIGSKQYVPEMVKAGGHF